MLTFILGLIAGALALWLPYTAKRKQIKILDEDKQLLRQEKQIVVEFMHNMVEAVAEGSDREAMFQRIIHAAILSTGAMSACIFEKRPNDTLKGIAVEGLFPPQRKLPKSVTSKLTTRTQFLESILKSETYKMGEGLIGQVAKSHRALLIADAQNDPRIIQHDDPSLQVRSFIVAPVLFQGELIAVLAVANPSDGLAFTETDFSLVESLAEQVGLAVHNSDAMQLQIDKNKLDTDIELASNIQGLLLPKKFPPADHIAFASHYTPAQKVGGDLYDVFALDEKTIAFAIADVSGKGISASILMAICQTHLRHFAKLHRSPSKVISSINEAMEHTMQRDMFITMVYAMIDLETEQLTLARAGHELPIFYDQHSKGGLDVGPIQSPGMAVGMVPPAVFDSIIQDTSIHFGSNDALLLYTDGITESANKAGEEYGSKRLAELLRNHGDKEAQDIINQTLESVRRFSQGTGQTDDLTLIAVKHA
ncbi:SpoIIE family protein phosphatase [Coraliomargarita sp. SDUM461004]|uniref:SpoIIE family protein phosphatase n=1 Tax=Thalassobacterium sedimentorum TaxID=3041258 RepID=A0ABU1AHU6_9BACT|nr:SpoIIE family protein phosphatase [Coraliomargarita sp. SDUM461004]MDQ8194396.1 SpoIIE family protein phosphatase [Coraliomargarita sp. SDUM461004]